MLTALVLALAALQGPRIVPDPDGVGATFSARHCSEAAAYEVLLPAHDPARGPLLEVRMWSSHNTTVPWGARAVGEPSQAKSFAIVARYWLVASPTPDEGTPGIRRSITYSGSCPAMPANVELWGTQTGSHPSYTSYEGDLRMWLGRDGVVRLFLVPGRGGIAPQTTHAFHWWHEVEHDLISARIEYRTASGWYVP